MTKNTKRRGERVVKSWKAKKLHPSQTSHYALIPDKSTRIDLRTWDWAYSQRKSIGRKRAIQITETLRHQFSETPPGIELDAYTLRIKVTLPLGRDDISEVTYWMGLRDFLLHSLNTTYVHGIDKLQKVLMDVHAVADLQREALAAGNEDLLEHPTYLEPPVTEEVRSYTDLCRIVSDKLGRPLTIEEMQALKNQSVDATWSDKLVALAAQLGREPTLEEMLELAKTHKMTPEEIEAQRQSWGRQDKD